MSKFSPFGPNQVRPERGLAYSGLIMLAGVVWVRYVGNSVTPDPTMQVLLKVELIAGLALVASAAVVWVVTLLRKTRQRGGSQNGNL